MVNVRLAESTRDREICLSIRWTVFVEEQGVPPSLEVDEHDRSASTAHVLGTVAGIPAGTGRLIESGKIGRLAVIDDVRKLGLGALLLQTLEDEARRRGLHE